MSQPIFYFSDKTRRGPPADWDSSHRNDWSEKDVPIPLSHGMTPLDEDWGCFSGGSGDWGSGGDRRGGWGAEEWNEHLAPSLGRPLRLVPHDPLLLIKAEEGVHDDR